MEKLIERYRKFIEEKGGEARFKEVVGWAQKEGLGSMIVVAVVLKEMMAQGIVEGVQERLSLQGLEEMDVPTVVKLLKPKLEEKVPSRPIPMVKTLDRDLELAVAYLNDYWSVGELRFMEDLRALGVREPSNVLRKLIELDYVEKTSSRIVNAKEKLPKVRKKGVSLASFL